jgi:signal transduction histidine kinase
MSPEDRHRYEEHKVSLMHKCTQVVAGLGACLFPLYFFIDLYVHTYALKELTLLRAVTTLIFLAFFFYLRKRQFPGNPRKLIFGLLIFAGMSVTGMCLLTGGYRSPVYAGVNLVLLTGALTYPVGALGMAGLVLSILGTFYLSVLVQAGFIIHDTAAFINNTYFLSSTGIISIAAAYLTELLRQESFSRFLQVEKAELDLKHQHEIKSKFFANVTHELRTPLTLIMGPLNEMIRDENISLTQKDSLLMAKRNAEILLKHVGDLLDVSKLEASNMEVRYSKVNLSHLTKRICSQFEVLARTKHIHFDEKINEGIEAEVDAEKYERILTNILSNAFKFTPGNGSIVVALNREDEFVKLSVSDSGPGIPQHLREKIFERFFQVEESNTRKFQGTGLGLAIVKEFTELQRGHVRVEDSKSGGASLQVSLPLKAPPGAGVLDVWNFERKISEPMSPELLPGENQILSSHATNTNRPVVLIVEDNQDMRTYITNVLSREYLVIEAVNGRDGLDKAHAYMPDLILSDVMMPEFSGIELLSAAKNSPELSAVPFIFLTARADDQLNLGLLASGAQDYLIKPFSRDELLIRIKNCIELKRSRDILQKELRSSNANVEVLAQEVTASLTEAQKALQLREEFIRLASHELNTPLTALKLEGQLATRRLNEGKLEASALRKFLQKNELHMNRLIQIVNDMLVLAKLKSSGLEIRKTKIDLDQLVRNIVETHRTDYASFVSSITITSPGPIIGEWDADKIEQVILNLLNNAIKFGRGLPIEIKLAQSNRSVMIHVKDSGIGIPETEQDKIFDEFERGSSSDYSGLGLGLFISKQVVDAHGGQIRVQSREGQGSLFTVSLPLS